MSAEKFDPDVWHQPEGSQAIVRGNPWLDTFETVTPKYVVELEARLASAEAALKTARERITELEWMRQGLEK